MSDDQGIDDEIDVAPKTPTDCLSKILSQLFRVLDVDSVYFTYVEDAMSFTKKKASSEIFIDAERSLNSLFIDVRYRKERLI